MYLYKIIISSTLYALMLNISIIMMYFDCLYVILTVGAIFTYHQ